MIKKEKIKIIFSLSLSVLFLILFLTKSKPADHDVVKKIIFEKMSQCKKEDDLDCYKQIATDLPKQFPMKNILDVFEENENDPIFFDKCHTTLHFLGQEEYKMTKNTAISLGEGTPVCFSGFYHGVLEAYFSESGFINDVNKLGNIVPQICGLNNIFSIKKTYHECLHGLGHAIMYATDDELPTSLKLCDKLDDGEDRNWCYSGVFMENSTSSTNKDHPSKYLKKSDPAYPCNILDKKYGNICYTLQSFYFAEISKYNWVENYNMCKKIPNEFQGGCINAIGQSQVGNTQDLKMMVNNCRLIKDESDYIECINGIVGGMGERYEDGSSRVLDFCNNTLTGKDQNGCYKQAISLSHNWMNTEKEFKKFCNKINSSEYKKLCLSSI